MRKYHTLGWSTCLFVSPIQISGHEVKSVWARVLELTLRLREEIWERGEADWRASGEVKEVRKFVLRGPKRGSEYEGLLISPHLVENLGEEWYGREGIAQPLCPLKEKHSPLSAMPECTPGTEEGKPMVGCNLKEVPVRCAPQMKDGSEWSCRVPTHSCCGRSS